MKSSYTYKYPRPSLTVDCVVFHKQEERESPKVLLIQRGNPPFKGQWAFPGGFVDMDEELEVAAQRELFEETGFTFVDLKQFQTFGTIGRDPRGRTVSVVYYGFCGGELPRVKGGDDASKACWFSLDELPQLAFDHAQIMDRLRDHLSI